MAAVAKGTFDVKLVPQATDPGGEAAIGRMSIDKQYHGDLDATATGQMLAHMTAVDGSGVYVAIERVDGTLHGLHGAFVLQHSGVMVRGKQQLSVTVVADSGTGELVGLSGTLDIIIADGKHSYTLTYSVG
jgi:Protein of unknown function (DUF3224)